MAPSKEPKIKWGMVIDIDRCTGCGACMVNCQVENNLPPAPEDSSRLRAANWMMVYEISNQNPFPNHDTAFLPRPCQQCGNPPCVSVCPVIATDKNRDGGIVSQVHPRCIGCRYCMAACPYHARYFNWFEPKWPEGMQKTLSPDVSTRPRGVVEKCTFCHHRLFQARENARLKGRDPSNLQDGEYITACAKGCPNGAILFGDLNNPKHRVHALAKSKFAFRLLERLGADPQVYYISRREWVQRMSESALNQEAVDGGNDSQD